MFRNDEGAGEPVLFRAERDGAYYWGPYAIGALAILPLAPLDPATTAGGLMIAAWVCAWSRRSFVFHLCATNIALRGAPLDAVYRIAWDDVRIAQVARARRPWFGRGIRGEVRLILTDETRVRIPGVRDPAAAIEAVNATLARRDAGRARAAAA